MKKEYSLAWERTMGYGPTIQIHGPVEDGIPAKLRELAMCTQHIVNNSQDFYTCEFNPENESFAMAVYYLHSTGWTLTD